MVAGANTAAGATGADGERDQAMSGAGGLETPVLTPRCRRRYVQGAISPGGAVSPAATKPRLHEQAVEPESIERELTMGKVTCSLWPSKGTTAVRPRVVSTSH